MSEFTTYLLPTLSVSDGAAAVEFYKKAFGAIVLMQIGGDGEPVVADLSVGGARFIVADEAKEYENYSPETLGGTPVRMG